jgi:hypothetical protein
VTYVKSPCKDCPDRVLGCHSECGRYLAYVEALEKIKQVRNGILHSYCPGPLLERNLRNKLNRTKKK